MHGQLFFASSNDLYTQFEYADDPDRVVIDLTDSHIWDASTVAALNGLTADGDRQGLRRGRHVVGHGDGEDQVCRLGDVERDTAPHVAGTRGHDFSSCGAADTSGQPSHRRRTNSPLVA